MIAFPDEKHLPGKMCKIRIFLEFGVKFCGGLLPKRALRGHNARGNGEVHGNVVESRHVKNPITLSVSHYKFTLQESSFCDFRSSSSHTTGSVSATA
jgi:hypothetical protein